MLRDVLGMATLSDVTEELSNLSDACSTSPIAASARTWPRGTAIPLYVDADGEARECGFSVISLGKLGGKELNYSSDIDLMFVYSANGETDGAEPISNKEFFKKVANQYTELLSTYTAEGFCYRVDLRLRPDGRHGEVCISLDGAREYYRNRGRDWELQMLIKARVSAGDREPGRDLLDFVEPLIYSHHPRFPRRRSGFRDARAHQRKACRAAARASSPAHSGLDIKLAPAGSAISNSWCSACSGCTAAASPGSGTAARGWPCSACGTRTCSPAAEYSRSGVGLSVSAKSRAPAAILRRSTDTHTFCR